MHLMEHRDAWFSHLKAHIETSYAHNGRKSMIMAHSWGANVVLHFLYWVDTLEPGGCLVSMSGGQWHCFPGVHVWWSMALLP